MIIRILNLICLGNFKSVLYKQRGVYIYEQIAIKNSYSPEQKYMTRVCPDQLTLQPENTLTVFNSYPF